MHLKDSDDIEATSDTVCEELFTESSEIQRMNKVEQCDEKSNSHVDCLNANISLHTTKAKKIPLAQKGMVNTESESMALIEKSPSLSSLLENKIASAEVHNPRGSLQHSDTSETQSTDGLTTNSEIKTNGNNVKLTTCNSSDFVNMMRPTTNASDPTSPAVLMKRRSSEISSLRKALQEKAVSSQQHHKVHLEKNLNLFVDLKFELCKNNNCSNSSYHKLQCQHSPNIEDNKALGNSNSKRNSWILSRPQEQNRITTQTVTSDPEKINNLPNNPESSSFTNWKMPRPFLSHRCSSPVSPQVSREGPDSCDSDGPTPEFHTPNSSPGPLKPKPKSGTQEKEHNKTGVTAPVVMSDGRVNYYPKCDPTIWIRSCTQEVLQPLSGEKSGVIPKWLRGALIRNGPGRVQVGQYQYNHLFDGAALLHRFHFSNGNVTYQNKFLESRSYLKDTKAQRIVVNYFGTRAYPDPCKTILQNIASKFTLEEHFTDNAQISLYPYGDGLYALTETPFMYRVDPETLNTHDKVNLTRHVAVFTHTAHPHVDKDGTVYNIGQGVGPFGPRYHICKFPNTKTNLKGKVKTPFQQAEIIGSVGARWMFNPCYMHSFAMTENYWVIIEQPFVVSVTKILKVLIKQDALIDALQWWEKETKIHVVRRDTGRVTSTQYVTETFFFLHTINAYEDDGHIILDIAAYKNAKMLQCMYVEALKNASFDPTYAQMFRGRPKRWVLPLKPNKDAGPHANLVTLPNTSCKGHWVKKNVVYVTPELLADIGCEVPRIYYEEYNGRHYQYFYAICSDVDHPSPGTLVKVDVVNKRHIEWTEDNVYPSEPIFVPSPHAKREDEGVVLCALLRAEGHDREVCLLVLDATTFTEMGRVEFNAPSPVPKCLHGWFVPEGSLGVYRNEEKQQEQEQKLKA